MTGDMYRVFYCTFANPNTEYYGVEETWRKAKALRDAKFYGDQEIKSCWIMVTNDVYNLQQIKYGITLQRRRAKKKESA